jgi:O-antigen ligase
VPHLDQRLGGERPEGAHPLGWRCFQLGLLLLASSALFAALLLLVSLVLGSRGRAPFWRDGLNRWLVVIAVLMVLGCFQAYSGWLAWVGLANWLPFFWGFWGFQPYVATPESRRRAALWLVVGTVPVVLTGLGQLWWGWSGPFMGLNGLLVWWIERGGNPPGRLSGLFDYANIAGAWLALAWPLALAALLQRRLEPRLRAVALLVVVGQAVALYLTDSRNAWGALVLALPIVAGPITWIWLLPLMVIAVGLVALASLPMVPAVLQHAARLVVPDPIWVRLSDANFAGHRPLAITRLSQWGVAMGLIAERPWLGWGAAAFSVIYPLRTGHWHGHPHNLPIDLALSHGLPAAVLLVAMAGRRKELAIMHTGRDQVITGTFWRTLRQHRSFDINKASFV